ncbi:MAG TPA: PA14 domain-containing protein [Oligoflexus sp.]|uniref:PA14 domain-containing protein n=1 Tax=Oligoflexus sp. TaxID=1971216 RepID=UPI002D7FC003|nr:PA14 domain-containing protein [Oligoflexus sp.]HET9239895.1 PA14 domain-containing protein [Oligoflexus sp.]
MRCFLSLSASILVVLQAMACQKSNFQRGDAVYAPPPRLQEPVETEPLPPPDTVTLPAPAPNPEPLFQDCEKDQERQMVAELFPLAENTEHLPDFSQMKATKKLCMRQLDITDRDFKEGFPGVDGLIEWFGLDIRFKLNVPVAGDYEFMLNSDDGSRLFIDGREVIENDGQHSEQKKTAVVALTAGLHELRLPYFQGPRYRIALELKWKGPGDSAHAYIPLKFILRP